MSEAQIDYNAIAEAAAEAEDQTNLPSGGGFEKVIPPEGRCMLRLVSYIELGKQKPKNPAHKPAVRCILEFEVSGKNHSIEVDGDDGKKKTVPNRVTIWINKGGAKSRYGRLFKSLNYSGKYNHFAQMIGKASWLGEISHKDSGTEGKPYVNLDKDGQWTFSAPVFENPATGETTQVPVVELHGTPRLFLWENPGLTDTQYLQLWDEIFIEGENDDGKSKNFLQEMVQKSVDYPGSRLARLLEDDVNAEDKQALDDALDEDEEPEEGDEPAPEPEEEKAPPKKKQAAKKPAKKKEPEPEPEEEEEPEEDDSESAQGKALAALGL